MPARLVVARHVDDRTLGPPDHRGAQPRHTGPDVAGEDQQIGVSAVRRPAAALKVQVAENLKAHTASMADANGRAWVPKRRVTLASREPSTQESAVLLFAHWRSEPGESFRLLPFVQ